MLTELRVRDLGVIADLTLVLGRGMTAVTGETGAGKTLVVEAIELLVGGRADAILARPGAREATVEGRFLTAAGDVVAARTVPADGGRSRAYIDGRMAPASALANLGADLLDLHGQHAHQSLLRPATQRHALDAFGGIDLEPLSRARAAVASIDARLVELGGDSRARLRELDLLGYQLRELEAADLRDAAEDDALRDEEDRLANATAHRHAASTAHDALAADGGAEDAIGAALGAVAARGPFDGAASRLRALQAEASDLAVELRTMADGFDDDPERLAEIGARRELLRELRRKYGETLGDVMAYALEVRARLEELEGHDALVQELEQERAAARVTAAKAESAVAAARRKAAPRLAAAIESHLEALAMPRAVFAVEVSGDGPADEVTFLLAPNLGEPALPLAKAASGGELARTMLACQLVLTSGPPTLIFDEVDSGIGGEAALAVGEALASLAREHQVVVVTHLAQVAAFADAHVAVTKHEVEGRTLATAEVLDEQARLKELARMLSGQPESTTARRHVEELLIATAERRQGQAAS